MSPRRRADAWAPDELLMDERFCAVQVRGRGRGVFSACSHAGIVNVLHAARALPGGSVLAVMGGSSFRRERGDHPQTVADLAGFDCPSCARALHGWRAVSALERAFGDRVAPAAVGKLYAFDAP